LILPLFLILNALFFVYWLLQFKRQVFLSALALLAGITFINKFYKFSSHDLPESDNDFVVMSYNVRLFNLFEWLPKKMWPAKYKPLSMKRTLIFCVSRVFVRRRHRSQSVSAPLHFHANKIRTGQAIYSKFPIIDEGNLVFPNSNNNVIFADIKKGKDVIRVYNMHLQSIKISPDVNEMSENVDEINQRNLQWSYAASVARSASNSNRPKLSRRTKPIARTPLSSVVT
jgi:hypothetical protein